MVDRYYSYNRYLRERFGCRVHRLSLHAGFSCPNLDGTLSRDGCSFCDNRAFSRYAGTPDVPLREQVRRSIEFSRRRYHAEKFIAYFQSFSGTYADTGTLKAAFDVIREFDGIVGLAVSTRPDCVDDAKLDLLQSYSPEYEVYVEYGLQSIHDRTLKTLNRNHTYADFQNAVVMTAAREKLHTAAHVIIGLPGESGDDVLETARAMAEMPLWGVKFHCLHVVKETALAEMYGRGEVSLLREDEYIDLLIKFLELTPRDRVILRLVSDADHNRLIAPLWVNEKQRVLQKIEKEMERRDTRQGKNTGKPPVAEVKRIKDKG